MNKVIMRTVDVTASYVAFDSENAAVSVTISCPPGNSGTVYFKGDDGTDIPWIPGEWHDFKGINLADIEIKGTVGDKVTIIGGTW